VDHTHTIFLLSPAYLGGRRAAMLWNPQASFAVARELNGPGGAPVGELFSFVSGLYFRGKMAYATTFGRPPPDTAPAFVISPSEGLRPLDERVTVDRLRAWALVAVDVRSRAYTRPLYRHAEELERAHGGDTRFVLLGSVATSKYVLPLTRVFGDHLLFPPDFVGRGDMSRGALLLRAVRAQQELRYVPVEGARLTTSARAPGRR
jgi:hypothetical protein